MGLLVLIQQVVSAKMLPVGVVIITLVTFVTFVLVTKVHPQKQVVFLGQVVLFQAEAVVNA